MFRHCDENYDKEEFLGTPMYYVFTLKIAIATTTTDSFG